MPKTVAIAWLSKPEDHDYPAAKSYLELLFDESQVKSYVEKLKKHTVQWTS